LASLWHAHERGAHGTTACCCRHALGLVLLGLGMALRDGAVVVLGVPTAASTVALVSVLLLMAADRGIDWAASVLA
jgi:hypothetical protein